MTRQHFQAVADSINETGQNNPGNSDVLLQVAQSLADKFPTFNSYFDRSKFMSACFRYQQEI